MAPTFPMGSAPRCASAPRLRRALKPGRPTSTAPTFGYTCSPACGSSEAAGACGSTDAAGASLREFLDVVGELVQQRALEIAVVPAVLLDVRHALLRESADAGRPERMPHED